MEELYSRINLNVELSEISKKICKEYGLGSFVDNKIITVGYEDFNCILQTDSGKYCIKIFNKERTDDDCKRYIDRIELASNLAINFPKVYKANGKIQFDLELDNVKYRICVFQFIDGESFYDLGIIPTEKELQEIIRQMAIIHRAKLDSQFIYDKWTIINVKQEFEDKKQYLEERDRKIIEPLVKKFEQLDLEKLPYSFVHGDIISTNVMKDKNNKLWIIDFAVSNYLPRIVDLAVSACNLCLTAKSKEDTREKIGILIKEYQKYNKLEEYEILNLPLFFDIANVMGVIQTTYENVKGNQSEENDYWLNESREGLEYSNKEFWKSILF